MRPLSGILDLRVDVSLKMRKQIDIGALKLVYRKRAREQELINIFRDSKGYVGRTVE
jgi:hypothetical protein